MAAEIQRGRMGNAFDRVVRAVAMAVMCAALESAAGECRLESSANRVTVMELYTSEGCSSCPPADRWLSGLKQQGIFPEKAVLLAFHVDYWNQLGWPDRFSRVQFSDRQRQVAARGRSRVIYTPQFTVDGRDFRQRYDLASLRGKLAPINLEKAKAGIRADMQVSASAVRVEGEVEVFSASGGRSTQVWIALFENGLSSRVTAGENAGARLDHDFVVRELAGPIQIGPNGRAALAHRLNWQAEWSPARMGIAIFVERSDTGEILQATANYPLCAS
jgi:hypothetical protein